MSKAQTIARIRAGWREIAPGQDIAIANYRPVDGEGVVRSILEVYGDKYPVEDFYVPRRISQLNASGDMITVVARTVGGQVVGHASLWRTSSLNPNLYEYGQVIVVPAYRQLGVAQRLTEPIARILDANEDVHGVFVEAVTNHVASQRLADFLGARPCALELALMPDGQFAGEGAGLLRVSCLMLARVIRDRRCDLCLPAGSRAMLEPVVREMGLERDLSFSHGTEPSRSLTEMKVQSFDSAGVVRCHITAPGRDLVQRIAEIVERRFVVIELFINTASMSAPWAVDVLQPHGFFLSGLVPLWFGADAIILQRLVGDIDTGALQFQSESANMLAAAVISGYRRTH